jgi:hypothetical protein
MFVQVVQLVVWPGWQFDRGQGCLEDRSCVVLSLGWSAVGAACSRLRCQLVPGVDRQGRLEGRLEGHLEVHQGLHIVAVVAVGRLGKETDLAGVPIWMKC